MEEEGERGGEGGVCATFLMEQLPYKHVHTFSDAATVTKPTAPGSVGTGRVSPKPPCSMGNA